MKTSNGSSPAVGGSLLVYAVAMFVVVVVAWSHGVGGGLEGIGIVALFGALFAARWREMTASQVARPGTALATGIAAGVVMGFPLAFLVPDGFTGPAAAISAEGTLFVVTLLVLSAWFVTRRAYGVGFFLTRKRTVGPWLSLFSGMWLGALVAVALLVLAAASGGVAWSAVN